MSAGFSIGGVQLAGRAVLAPMAGVTDSAFRGLCLEQGAALVYTEMVSAKALCYNDRKTAALLHVPEGGRPVSAQIFGHEPESMAEGAKRALDISGAEIIDINMGCPAPKIVNNGEGSALMKDVDKIYRIVSAVSKASSVSVTVKLRKGFDEAHCNALEAAKAAQAGGAAAVTVHGRTREQYYCGKADWDVVGAVKAALDIPVIGNGDIFCAQDAADMLSYTGCDAVMVGRGAQGNPFLFRQIGELLQTGQVTYTPTLQDKVDTMLTQFAMMVADKGEYIAVREARKHAAWYLKGEKHSASVRSAVNNAQNAEELKNILQSIL